jgi:hypothetical protein
MCSITPRLQQASSLDASIATMNQSLMGYRPFVAKLRAASVDPSRSEVHALLDGAAGRELRNAVALDVRKRVGAFFTSSDLADRCLEQLAALPRPVLDPACGAGDLLLAAARRLPIFSSARKTLTYWGECLHGVDIVPEFVSATKLRLALLAMERTGDQIDLPTANRLLGNIRVGNGLRRLISSSVSGLLFLNPPFGSTSEFRTHFNGSGRVARAGIFVDQALRALAPNAWLVAILPDVLRSGSSYSRWRKAVSEQLNDVRVVVEGRFDATTDVDVFVLMGKRPNTSEHWERPVDWYQVGDTEQTAKVADAFDVHVGPIVEYRDKGGGRNRAFITTRDLAPWTVQTRIRNTWPAGNRAIDPPFVAVGRTSSPHDQHRLVASVISGKRPVAVENHLLTLQPRSGRLNDALRLMTWLGSSTVTEHLQHRIRCRHLTVSAINELPWPGPT